MNFGNYPPRNVESPAFLPRAFGRTRKGHQNLAQVQRRSVPWILAVPSHFGKRVGLSTELSFVNVRLVHSRCSQTLTTWEDPHLAQVVLLSNAADPKMIDTPLPIRFLIAVGAVERSVAVVTPNDRHGLPRRAT